MPLKEIDFQNAAVNKLIDAYIAQKKNVILEAPTGSGKTAILIKLMDRLLMEVGTTKNIAFVWLTPGAGNLEEQSWKNTANYATRVKPQFLDDALNDGFNAGTATFLNWELVSKSGNIALRKGEKTNLPKEIKKANNKGISFILIIDEEHRNQTKKAQKIIDLFDSDIIYRASATPIRDASAKLVRIDEDDVIAAGMITREVVLNDQFDTFSDERFGSDEDFIDAANNKRLAIKQAYKKLNKDINPLVLIQFPDEKKFDKEISEKVKNVKDYLINELNEKPENIAVWLSDKHENVDGIEKNNSPINYLFMKQAVSTGWDAPRAKVLIKLRLNTSARFTIQTIGRIRRMPEQKHYNNELLDNSFVYSNDEKYVSEVIKQNVGAGLTQMSLKKEVDPGIFNLVSLKRKNYLRKDLPTVTKALREEFEREYDISKQEQPKKNQQILEDNNWYFGTEVLSQVPHGKIERLVDFAELDTVSVKIPIVNTRDWGYRYDAVMALIAQYLHVGYDLKNIRAIISDLFANSEPGSDVKRILKLNPRERYGFVINNARKLRDVAKAMDAEFIGREMTFDEANSTYKHDEIPLKMRVRDGYPDDGSKKALLKKNIYSGYSKSNWVKHSLGERMLEEQVESIPSVKWIYRSKDHGSDYFSIPYDEDTRDFYPDYLIKDVSGQTYIIEVKGADNIDEYAEAKFNALKNYVKSKYANGAKFAFVRQSKQHPDVLLYSDSKWSDDLVDLSVWKPLKQLFD